MTKFCLCFISTWQYLSLYQNHINDFLRSYIAFILTLPKAISTWPGGQNIVWYFDCLPSSNQCQGFVLIRSIKILTSLMVFWVVLPLLIFTLPKTIPTWPGGQNIVWYFDPPSNDQWQSFICLSYLLEKMYYYIKIMLMTSLVFLMLLFCTTNTWFHKVMNCFISCKLKHQSPPHFILITCSTPSLSEFINIV